MRVLTLYKALLFVLFLTVALVWAVIYNAKPLTVNILNNILADDHIEVLNFDAEYVSLDHIRIPRLILKIEDSHIAIQEFNLEFRDGLKILKNQQINTEDIVSIKTQSVYVDLGDSFFIRQSQQTQESPATLQLNLAKLPSVELGEITIKLPAQDGQVKQQPTLKMDKLTLSPNGQLDTVWRFNDYPLFSLDAILDKREWQFNTLIDLGLSYQGLVSLEQYLNTFNSQQNQPQTNNMLYGLQKQLTQILQPIRQQQIDIEGQWASHSKIDLLTGEMSSQQSIDDFSLRSPRWPSIYFTPQQPIKMMLNLGNYPVKTSLAKGQSTDTYALKLVIAPINYQLTPSEQDRNKLITLLADDNASQITSLIEKLTPKSALEPAHINVVMESPIDVIIPLQNNELPIQFSTPNIAVGIEGLLLQSKLKLSHFTLNSHQQFSTDFDWDTTLSVPDVANQNETELEQRLTTNTKEAIESVTISTNPASNINPKANTNAAESLSKTAPNTINIKSLLPNIPLNQLMLSEAKANLVGHLTQQQNQLNLSLASNSNLIINHTNLSQSIISDNESQGKQTQNNAAQWGSVELIFNETSTMGLNQNNTQILLAPFTIKIDKLIAQQTTLSDKRKTSNTQASLDSAVVSINQPSSLTLAKDDPIDKSIEHWLQSPSVNDITWRINKLDMTKQVGKSRPQPLLALDKINMTQQLNLSKGLLVGNEQWQLDSLNLNSYHLLKFENNKSPLSLAGQWTFNTDIETALNTLQKVQPLPNDFAIQGHSKLIASFALSEIDNTSQFEMKIQQQLSALSGQWQDKSFTGGDVFAQCQFNWQQIHDAPNTPSAEKHFAQSELICPQTAISLQQAKLGLSLTNLNLNADIKLNKDGNKTPTNWLQQVTGLSTTNVNLTASGDMLDGRFLLPEFVLKLQEKSYGYLLLQGLSLEKFLQEQPQVGVKANGLFDGVLPAELVDGKVTIAGGKLAARSPGGLIEVAGNPAIDRLELSQPYLELVFTALEHLNYSELASTFDMTPNGDAVINIGVKGNSRGVERPVHLNYSHQENLIQLYRSTQVSNKIQNQIEVKVQ